MSTASQKIAPTDHPAKAGHVRLGGKEWPVRPGLDDDWAFIELAAAAEDGSSSATVKLAKYVLLDNAKAYEALKRDAAGEDGGVSVDRVGEIIQTIIKASAPNS